jgi:hypothetical protein
MYLSLTTFFQERNLESKNGFLLILNFEALIMESMLELSTLH